MRARMSNFAAMSEEQVFSSASLSSMQTQSLLSPRKRHVSAHAIGGDLSPLRDDAAQKFLATLARGRFKFGSAPPARANGLAKPPLLSALMSGSTDQVRLALEADPEAAQFPFWDHGVEPPLCCAVRTDCCSDIIEMLLASGADPSSRDLRGNLPLTLLNAKMAYLENLSSSAESFAGLDSPPLAGCLADSGLPTWPLGPLMWDFEEGNLPSPTMITLPLPSVADKLRSRGLLEADYTSLTLHCSDTARAWCKYSLDIGWVFRR